MAAPFGMEHACVATEMTQWSSPEQVDMVGANMFRPVNEQIVGRLMRGLIQPGADILEVGSGLGHLAGLVPTEFHEGYVQSDATPSYVQHSAANNPGVRAEIADVYHLPYGHTDKPGDTRTFDAVVAMDFLDVIDDLPAASREIGRVLNQNGVFLHMHNRRPSMGRLSRIKEFSGYYVFPFVDSDNSMRRFQLVRPEDYAAIRPKLITGDASDVVAEHPQYLDLFRERDRQLFEAIAKDLAANLRPNVAVTDTFSVLMHKLAAQALLRAGLQLDYAGVAEGEKQVSRKWVAAAIDSVPLPTGIKDKRYWNVFQKEASGPTSIDHEVIPGGQVIIRNQLSVLVAHKPAA